MYSILFDAMAFDPSEEAREEPVFFPDLNLDQVIEAITAAKEEYDLKPFFYLPLKDVRQIRYRHDVFRDLEDPSLAACIRSFAQRMRAMREHLSRAQKLYYNYQKKRWFLDAVEIYCDAVADLLRDLELHPVRSRGFLGFRAYLQDYCRSERFLSLVEETKALQTDLSEVRYCVFIRNNTVRVHAYESLSDYTVAVERTFQKFESGATKDYRAKFPSWPEMNHVEARILDFVAKLHPEIFGRLDRFPEKQSDYLDETITRFDREIQFYIAYLEYLQPFRKAGLAFSYPRVSDTCRDIDVREGFDIALARELLKNHKPLVTNDFHLCSPETIFVVTGPNQGGKTTFSRTFGQLHYLAGIGCLVPGKEAQLFMPDNIFTHFEKEEELQNLRGKLLDDLVRIHAILERSTSKSVVIVNEIFSSTTLQDARSLSRVVMEKLMAKDLFCVWVTFLDELASLSEKTVSMVGTVDPEDPTVRTFKIVRRPPDGLTYALTLVERHRLTYQHIKERLRA